MLYAIFGADAPDSLPLRIQARSAHLARLQELADQGRLIIAGPHPAIDAPDPGIAGFTGSLVIAEFASQPDAESWASQDPYLECGAWVSAAVKPFLQVLP